MKDVSGTLRRIDEEITGHHQRIAYHQVEIMRLQETRKVLMGIAEADIAAAEHERMDRTSMINGAHAKPVLIVRRTGTGDENGTASRAAKTGEPVAKQRKKRGPKSVSGDFRQRILETLEGVEEGMTSMEIGDYLGIPRGDEPRKPMSNALYQLKVAGKIARDDDKRYSLLRPQ